MSTINPTLPNPELIKIEVDQFQSASIEREKNMKMEMEMENLVREREWLKKEIDLLERTQSFTELEKCNLEEKLRRSERRCEELDERVVQMGEKVKKFEDLRRKEIEIAEALDELRVKKMESEKTAQFYKSRVDDLEPRVLKVEATLAKVLNVNLAKLVGAMDKFAAAATDAGDGNVVIGLSKKGGRNLAYSGTEEDGANVLFSYPGSKPAHISKVAESEGSLQDNEDTNPEVRGASYRMKLDCRCRLKIIDVIKDNLQKENLEIFEQSCFGNLMMINELKFQGKLISQLLLHMDMSTSNEERLIFKINNSNMEFGPSDFFCITGLRFGKLEATISKKSSSIHKDVFQGRPIITLKDVEEAFLNISSCHKGKGELTLKLALLYFLYGTLLTKRCRNKIDVQYLHLIEDLQKFNAFPWGRVAYDFLVSSILQLRLRMDDSEVTHQVARFDIYGFCYALQTWAYEVMPCVAIYCASHADNFDNITPWILRWSATRILKSDDLKKFFSLGDKAHLNNTMGKWEELSTDTIPHVAKPLNWAKQKKRKLLCDNDQMHHPQPSSAATPTSPPPPPPPPSTNAPKYPSHHLARRLSQAEGMLKSLLRKLDISYDDLSRNEFSWVDDEENVSAATLTRHGTSGPTPVSMNKATDKHAKLEKSFAETEQVRALSELANDNPALDKPQLLWKAYSDFEISEQEYERTKALYEMLLNRTKHLQLWISYAKFEAFAMKEILQESDLPDKRKCLERARAVFERGLSYFRSCVPELKEERAMLLEKWFDMESSFGEVGDVELVRAKLPQKLITRRHIETEDGYEEYIEYQFPEEKRSTNLEILEAAYKWKKHKTASDDVGCGS